MKLPLSIAKSIIAMQKGDKIPFSKMKHAVVEAMIENGILLNQTIGRSKALIYIKNNERLTGYLANHFGIHDLDKYIEGLLKDDLLRSEAVDISSDSKIKYIRTFKGFLINCLQPVECTLHNRRITIHPQPGAFTFIYDFESFVPTKEITIVGIENPENFRHIEKQQRLFEHIQPLFVSRYPQSKDLVKWLQLIPNAYLHFGDFDFDGLNIYINAFKKHLHNKAAFFLPLNIEQMLESKGNRNNYFNQSIQFDRSKIEEANVHTLIKLIEKYKKGLEQEIFAR